MTQSLSSKETGDIWAHQRDVRIPQTRGEVWQLAKSRTDYAPPVPRPPCEPETPHRGPRAPLALKRRQRQRSNRELALRACQKREALRAHIANPNKPDDTPVLQDWQRCNRVYVGSKIGTGPRSPEEEKAMLIRLALGFHPLVTLMKHNDRVHFLFGMRCADFVEAVESGVVAL